MVSSFESHECLTSKPLERLEQLGNAIRRARKKRSMSQSELGVKAGLRQETISLLENGNAAVKLETILAILSVLGLELQISTRKSKETPFQKILCMADVNLYPQSQHKNKLKEKPDGKK